MANRKSVHVVQRDNGWGTLREGAGTPAQFERDGSGRELAAGVKLFKLSQPALEPGLVAQRGRGEHIMQVDEMSSGIGDAPIAVVGDFVPV